MQVLFSSQNHRSIDTRDLQPFAKILASFIDNTAPNLPVVHNLVSNFPFQQQPQNIIPQVMAQLAFPFPLPSLVTTDNLKNIPSNVLPKFYGLATEDPDTFLFEFDILCHSFDYNTDAHKLKLFPTTLKESAL